MSLTSRISDLAVRTATEFKAVKSKIAGNTSGDLSSLTTTVKTSLLAAINELVSALAGKQNSLGFTPENAGENTLRPQPSCDLKPPCRDIRTIGKQADNHQRVRNYRRLYQDRNWHT